MTRMYYLTDDRTRVGVLDGDTGDPIESGTLKLWASVIPDDIDYDEDIPVPDNLTMAVYYRVIYHLFNDPVALQKYNLMLRNARKNRISRASSFVNYDVDL